MKNQRWRSKKGHSCRALFLERFLGLCDDLCRIKRRNTKSYGFKGRKRGFDAVDERVEGNTRTGSTSTGFHTTSRLPKGRRAKLGPEFDCWLRMRPTPNEDVWAKEAEGGSE